MKNLIKKLLGIKKLEDEIAKLKQQVANNELFVSAKMSELKEFTRVDADIGVRGNNTIILSGVYRNKAYVRFYDLGDGEFESLLHQLKDMCSFSTLRNIDAPPAIRGSFRV